MYRRALHIVMALLLSVTVLSQEKEQKEELRGAHRLTTGLGHTQMAKGKNIEGSIVWLAAPSWSFNYDYWISNKWALGLQTDVVLEKYIVEQEDGIELEREKPWTTAAVAIFKPGKRFSFLAGAGVELEKEESLGLTRLGIEYGIPIRNGWEAGIAVVWDAKWGHYSSWALEFSFSKFFFKKRSQ